MVNYKILSSGSEQIDWSQSIDWSQFNGKTILLKGVLDAYRLGEDDTPIDVFALNLPAENRGLHIPALLYFSNGDDIPDSQDLRTLKCLFEASKDHSITVKFEGRNNKTATQLLSEIKFKLKNSYGLDLVLDATVLSDGLSGSIGTIKTTLSELQVISDTFRFIDDLIRKNPGSKTFLENLKRSCRTKDGVVCAINKRLKPTPTYTVESITTEELPEISDQKKGFRRNRPRNLGVLVKLAKKNGGKGTPG